MSCKNENFGGIGRADLHFRHGDTADAWSIQLLDNEQKPIPLEGYNFLMEIRKKDVRGSYKIEARKVGAGLKIVDNLLIIERREKEELAEGVYEYALKVKEPDGDVYTFLNGSLTIQNQLVDEEF